MRLHRAVLIIAAAYVSLSYLDSTQPATELPASFEDRWGIPGTTDAHPYWKPPVRKDEPPRLSLPHIDDWPANPAKPVTLPIVIPQLPVAEPFKVRDALPECMGARTTPCIIRSNPGGNLYAFQSAARQVLAGARELVVIDGLCASGCAIFADMARARVCITRRADFQLHKGRSFVPRKVANAERLVFVGYFDPPHSEDIASWVKQHGGFPEKGMLRLPYAEAAKIWRTCELTAPIPRPHPLRKAAAKR